MAYWMGQIIGGVIAIFLVSRLLEWAIFQRTMDEPVKGAIASVFSAYVIIVIIYMFNHGNSATGPLAPALTYLPGAIIVCAATSFWRFRKARSQEEELID